MKNKNICYKCNKAIEIGDLVSSDFFSHINCKSTQYTNEVKVTAVQYLKAIAAANGK